MGMSMHVVGLRDPDSAEHQAKVDAVRALRDAGEDVLPPMLADYFKTRSVSAAAEEPNAPIEVDLDRAASTIKYRDESMDGFVVDLSKLPPGVTHIRFCCAY